MTLSAPDPVPGMGSTWLGGMYRTPPLTPSITEAQLGNDPNAPYNPWPGPYPNGPEPTLVLGDSRLVEGWQGLAPPNDSAGTFTDPNTGIVYAAYTKPVQEPKVLRDEPVITLGEPSRMLEALTGVSAVTRPCRQESINTWEDIAEGLKFPEALVEMAVRNETTQRNARELYFTNRESEAGFNDTHWDGYIGTTYVLRPTYDTQTVSDNNESNTTVLPFRPIAEGNLAVPMYHDGTEWGGAMMPGITVLAQDKVRGVPHVHSEYEMESARFPSTNDGNVLLDLVNTRLPNFSQSAFESKPNMFVTEKVTDNERYGTFQPRADIFQDETAFKHFTVGNNEYVQDAQVLASTGNNTLTLNVGNLLAATNVDKFPSIERVTSSLAASIQHGNDNHNVVAPQQFAIATEKGKDSKTAEHYRLVGDVQGVTPHALASVPVTTTHGVKDSSVLHAVIHAETANESNLGTALSKDNAKDAAYKAHSSHIQETAYASGNTLFAAPEYAEDSISGAVRAEPSHFVVDSNAFVPGTDKWTVEKTTAPGRVSNSRTFFWTDQSIVAEEMPRYIQDPEKGQAQFAANDNVEHERFIMETNAVAHPFTEGKAAPFRNMYVADCTPEIDIFKGRSITDNVLHALLQNQLYKRVQNDTVHEPSFISYESDV